MYDLTPQCLFDRSRRGLSSVPAPSGAAGRKATSSLWDPGPKRVPHGHVSGAWPGHEWGRLLVPLVGSKSYAWLPHSPECEEPRPIRQPPRCLLCPCKSLWASVGQSVKWEEVGQGHLGRTCCFSVLPIYLRALSWVGWGGVGWGSVECQTEYRGW